MELDQIRLFYEAANTQNLSKAAQNLHISQPSLSKAIARLEAELSLQLFDRRGRKVVLNENGKVLLQELEPVIRQLDQVQSRMESLGRSAGQTVVLGVYGETDLLSPCLAAFTAQHPNIRVELRCNIETIPRLDISEYDMLLYPSGEEAFRKYSGVQIAARGLMLAVHKQSPLWNECVVTPEQLRGQRFVVVRKDTRISMVERVLLRTGTRIEDMVVTDSDAMQLSLIAAGLGVGITDRGCTGGYTAADSLRFLHIDGKAFQTGLSVCFKRDKLLSDSGRLFREHLLSYFGIAGES